MYKIDENSIERLREIKQFHAELMQSPLNAKMRELTGEDIVDAALRVAAGAVINSILGRKPMDDIRWPAQEIGCKGAFCPECNKIEQGESLGEEVGMGEYAPDFFDGDFFRLGARLEMKNGPYGLFWGCEKYPTCKCSAKPSATRNPHISDDGDDVAREYEDDSNREWDGGFALDYDDDSAMGPDEEF